MLQSKKDKVVLLICFEHDIWLQLDQTHILLIITSMLNYIVECQVKIDIWYY